MVLTPSTMLPLGTPAPNFNLLEVVSGECLNLNQYRHREPLLIVFICQHCPFVKHIQAELAKIGQDYHEKVGIVAISSNDVESHPSDAPQYLKEMAQTLAFRFPYCYDETQEVAIAYRAACTPDFFLFDQSRTLVYRGQLDSSRPGNDIPVTGKDLRAAIDAVLAGTEVSSEQMPSIGCNIKWKPGKQPNG